MGGLNSASRGFWIEFSVALGFVGLTMLSLQFLLTARFRRVAAPYGIDIILEFHKLISVVATCLILAHPVILFAKSSAYLRLLNIFEAPLRAQMGILALVSLIIILIISLFRKQLSIKYEIWKTIHGVLAIVAVSAAFFHVLAVGHYLSLQWKVLFWELTFAATLSILFYIRIYKPWRLVKKDYIVEEVIQEKGNSWTLVFRPDKHEGMKFKPGQFVWLTLGNSPFAIEEHPFSITSSAAHPEKISLTIKELGDYTSAISKKAFVGRRAYLDGPYGVFTPDRNKDAAGYVFITGGIGITPVISMLRTFADTGEKRPLILFYSSREPESITFLEDLDVLRKKLSLKVIHVLEKPPADWQGESGFINAATLKKYLPAEKNSMFYFICGPPPMMEAMEKALLDEKISFQNIEMEYFNLV